MRKVRSYNTLRSVICLPLIISLSNSHPGDFSHFLKRSTLAEKIESILWFASLLTLEWGCWELNYQRGNTRYWIGIPPSIGSIWIYHKKSSHHACPLQWVVHTAGYLESPPSLRFRSSKLPPRLPDLVDRSPSETGHPPRGLTICDVFIDIRWTVSLQSQNSWIETNPILGQIITILLYFLSVKLGFVFTSENCSLGHCPVWMPDWRKQRRRCPTQTGSCFKCRIAIALSTIVVFLCNSNAKYKPIWMDAAQWCYKCTGLHRMDIWAEVLV